MTRVIVAAVLLVGGTAFADEEESHERTVTLSETYQPGWYMGIGASNYYPKLRESEARIDRQLNRRFGWLPFWRRPTTFADWRDKHFLWDLTIGVGRDLSPKTTLFIWTGGAKGTIKNKERYGPLDTDIRFTRTSAFLTPELFWYPWGKVNYQDVAGHRGRDWVRAALSGAKPYLAAASGYTWVRAEADGKFNLPLVGAVFRQTEKEDHHMFMFSPRAGIEFPTGDKSSISAVAIYYFFSTHIREYNGPCISINYRWRF